MNSLVRRRALEVAAKVTLSVSLVRCGGVVADGAPATPSNEEAGPSTGYVDASRLVDAAVAVKLDAGVSIDAEGNCSLPTNAKDASAADYACCTAQVVAEHPDAGTWSSGPNAPQASEGNRGCCDVVLAGFYSHDFGPDGASNEEVYVARNLCCANPEFSKANVAACTPWGPPMPPSTPESMQGFVHDEVA